MCRDGYRLRGDKKTCMDIDECAEQTSGCEQNCTNSVGSFQCSCNDGYTLEKDNTSCDISKRLDVECKKLTCEYGCREEGAGSFVCFCQSGYVLSADKTTCEGKQMQTWMFKGVLWDF
ncbi:hypothetical protein NP493_1438g00012 [Ridgeia piscesae]|uniref:EGF-like domain-containing protein n=1 Tax=Ridgeia piscesae TaxID=27915 RepID=A0AAD9K3D1_RIDPI|nr:hypothetical protein NP493_1438g00012 [Ridgeia piscesae]